jgi:hypothetical protein
LSGFADEIIDVEDYLLVPRIIGGAMKVPALITVVAVPIGVCCSGQLGLWWPIRSLRRCSCSLKKSSIRASMRADPHLGVR